jgi:hypothetical protein
MRMVKISAKLLGSWFMTGYKQVAIEVVEGVPKGSELLDVTKIKEGFELLFAHPDGVIETVSPFLRADIPSRLRADTPLADISAFIELREAVKERLPVLRGTFAEGDIARIEAALRNTEVMT